MDASKLAGEARPTPRGVQLLRARVQSGQATIEFALVSIAFMTLVLGTVDFGRAIFMYSQLHNAVREGARYGKINPSKTAEIKNVVVTKATSLAVSSSSVTVSCTGGCSATSSDVTVTATAPFQAVFQEILGISPITLSSSATVEAE
jgi:Flp pilus assembly protein TadG